ncbi:MAG: FKBP-type peptidyl-prolyl cis-trans isomerase [Bacteroidales bacterium]|nr:FKBP-type peptidyl-prolyl cis-trans isomerase [Bacteroidales bacterium]
MKTKTILSIVIAVLLLAVASSCKKTKTQLEEDTKAIKDYLSANGISAEEVSNVFCKVITEGTGEQCILGDTVAIKYQASTIDNPTNIFERNKGDKAVIYYLPSALGGTATGGEAPIYGLQVGLTTMKEGGKSRFYIPSTYAYGSSIISSDSIEYANVIYEVELCEIIHRDKKH